MTRTDIDVHTALHGGEVEVKGLYEPLVRLKIPPGTSSHQKITLPGQGIRREGLYGDQIVEIGIDTSNIKEPDRTLLEDLATSVTDSGCAIVPTVISRKFR